MIKANEMFIIIIYVDMQLINLLIVIAGISYACCLPWVHAFVNQDSEKNPKIFLLTYS